MKSKQIKFEDMKDLKYGDIIIIKDPMFEQGTPYVLMSNLDDKSFYFINGAGGSLMVNCQETIKGFNVRLIDDTHPSWNPDLSAHGKEIGKTLEDIIQLG